MKYLSLIVISFFSFKAVAQQVYGLDIMLHSGQNIIQLNQDFSAFAMESQAEFELLSFELDGKEFPLTRNLHIENQHISNIILFDSLVSELLIFSAAPEMVEVKLWTYNGSYTEETKALINNEVRQNKKEQCEKPLTIDQDIWRKDLPEPKPNPASTKVEHLIVHHSATYNTITDYLMAVRNIYLYHLNTNGWDDVGYNFLITADGTLWAGRDGQGLDDDNVRGAHFCAKNSNTMGVCLVGNYSEIPPTDTMLSTLTKLLAWKTKKDNLQPLEKSFHPIGSATGFYLPTICGHRDGYKQGLYEGCQTECPGSYTYAILDSIRAKTVKLLQECDYAVGISNDKNENQDISKWIFADQVKIYNSTGQLIFSGKAENYNLQTLNTGMYFLVFEEASVLKTHKFFKN